MGSWRLYPGRTPFLAGSRFRCNDISACSSTALASWPGVRHLRLGEVSKAAFRLNLRTLLRRAQPKSLDLNHALNFVQFVLDEIAQQAALQCIVILDLGRTRGKSRIYDE